MLKRKISSRKPRASIFTTICLWIIAVSLGFYLLSLLILANSGGFNDLYALAPLFIAQKLSWALVGASVIQLVIILKRREELNYRALIVVFTPILMANIVPMKERYDSWRYNQQYKANNTVVNGHYRDKNYDTYIRSISAAVYMPHWKTGRAVDIQPSWNKTLRYDLKYAPNQPDKIHRDGEPDFNSTMPNSPEYFDVYVHSTDDDIKQYVNPPQNCDIESAIKYARDSQYHETANIVSCVIISKNIQGAPLYGQNNWLNTDNHKFAATVFDGNSLHLFDNYGLAEKELGGELSQLNAWQKDFIKFNPDDFGRNDD